MTAVKRTFFSEHLAKKKIEPIRPNAAPGGFVAPPPVAGPTVAGAPSKAAPNDTDDVAATSGVSRDRGIDGECADGASKDGKAGHWRGGEKGEKKGESKDGLRLIDPSPEACDALGVAVASTGADAGLPQDTHSTELSEFSEKERRSEQKRNGEARTAFLRAKTLRKFGNDAEAIKFFTKAANKGHATAMRELGELLLVTSHSYRNKVQGEHEAVEWYVKAAEAGDAEAALQLSCEYDPEMVKMGKQKTMTRFDMGVTPDKARAKYYRTTAAKAGSAEGMVGFVMLLLQSNCCADRSAANIANPCLLRTTLPPPPLPSF